MLHSEEHAINWVFYSIFPPIHSPPSLLGQRQNDLCDGSKLQTKLVKRTGKATEMLRKQAAMPGQYTSVQVICRMCRD